MLALEGGAVVSSLDPPRVGSGTVLVDDGRISGVVDGPAPAGTTVVDCAGCVVIPGNVCAHHHLYSALARGMPYDLAPPADFVQILQRVWWRLDRALDEPANRASARTGGADALLAGTTTIVDHHASPETIDDQLTVMGDALTELGARSVLCYEVTDRDGAERAAAGLAENRRLVRSGTGGLVRGMVGAHASFTLSDGTLEACAGLADELGVGIHIHVAEDTADEADALARFGTRIVQRLAGAGALDDRSLLAHCVHVDDAERELIASSGATVVHNARSNMHNRVGHAPVGSFPRIALGTDGIDGDMFAEARAAFWRAHEEDPTVGTDRVLSALATSARFAGSCFGEPQLGRIEPGAPADLVVLEYDPPTPLGSDNLAGHWVFGFTSRLVRDVLVAGEPVVRDRRLVRADLAEIRALAREQATLLWARIDRLPAHPFEPRGGA
ncbi:MAG TPA: amidohydrolase family protein [Actinomycetota bacterium]